MKQNTNGINKSLFIFVLICLTKYLRWFDSEKLKNLIFQLGLKSEYE